MQFKLKLYTEYNMTKYKPQTAKTTFVDNFITHTKKKLAKHMWVLTEKSGFKVKGSSQLFITDLSSKKF